MTPFSDELFTKEWKTNSGEIKQKQKELVEQNPPTISQVIDFIVQSSTDDDIIQKLYFVYRLSPVTDMIGWDVKPSSSGVGGFLKKSFYQDLLNALSDNKRHVLFPYLPTSLHNETTLLDYLENSPQPKLNNYHGRVPSQKVLEWVLKNRTGLIKTFEKEWWTPKLKTQALGINAMAIAYIPEDLLTKAEVRLFLQNDGEKYKDFMSTLWNRLSAQFKEDPEIFARWLINSGGLAENARNVTSQPFYTLEGIKKYFELTLKIAPSDWSSVKYEWRNDKDLIDMALPKTGGEILVSKEIELTNSLLEKGLTFPLVNKNRLLLAARLNDAGRLTPELLKKIKLTYQLLQQTSSFLGDLTEFKKLIKNEIVVKHFIEQRDTNFFAKKTNWPSTFKLTKEHVIDMLYGLDFSRRNIDPRIKGKLTEDDFIWLYFEAKKHGNDVELIRKYLLNSAVDGVIIVAEDTIKLLKDCDENADYESFKDVVDLFVFN